MSNRNMPYRILFYGDSNTWGYIPGGTRLPKEKRFPILAAQHVPNGLALEEGLNGRNACFAHPLSPAELLGGATLEPILTKNLPINALCLMLGTNDMLPPLYRNADTIAADLQHCIHIVRKNVPDIPILLVSPVPVANAWIEELEEEMGACQALRIEPMEKALANLAATEKTAFFDPTPYIPEADGGDGVHLSEFAHATLGEHIGKILKTLSSHNTA